MEQKGLTRKPKSELEKSYTRLMEAKKKFIKQYTKDKTQRELLEDALNALLVDEDFREAFAWWRASLKHKLGMLNYARMRSETRRKLK